MSCPNEKISFYLELKRFHFVEAFTTLCKLAQQDMTTFAFRQFLKIFSFLWRTLTLELKLKKLYPIIKMTTLKDLETYLMTLELSDNGCRIHSISDGDKKIVTNERYVVMPWKMVTIDMAKT